MKSNEKNKAGDDGNDVPIGDYGSPNVPDSIPDVVMETARANKNQDPGRIDFLGLVY